MVVREARYGKAHSESVRHAVEPHTIAASPVVLCCPANSSKAKRCDPETSNAQAYAPERPLPALCSCHLGGFCPSAAECADLLRRWTLRWPWTGAPRSSRTYAHAAERMYILAAMRAGLQTPIILDSTSRRRRACTMQPDSMSACSRLTLTATRRPQPAGARRSIAANRLYGQFFDTRAGVAGSRTAQPPSPSLRPRL